MPRSVLNPIRADLSAHTKGTIVAAASGVVKVPLFARFNGEEFEVGVLEVPITLGPLERVGNFAVSQVRVGEVTV